MWIVWRSGDYWWLRLWVCVLYSNICIDYFSFTFQTTLIRTRTMWAKKKINNNQCFRLWSHSVSLCSLQTPLHGLSYSVQLPLKKRYYLPFDPTKLLLVVCMLQEIYACLSDGCWSYQVENASAFETWYYQHGCLSESEEDDALSTTIW
jgi:hypothetical protein